MPVRPSRATVGAVVPLGLAAALLGVPALAADHRPAPGTTSVAVPPSVSADDAPFHLAPLGTHRTGVFDEGAAEIVAFHAATQLLFVVNADAGTVSVVDAADPVRPTELARLAVAGVVAADGSIVPDGAVANSVAVRPDGLVVVAVEAPTKTDAGWLVLFDAAGDAEALGAVRVGSLPDMVALAPDGSRAVVANEGEPDDAYAVDPEGSVSVVDLPDDVAAPTQDDVRTATFHAYEAGGTSTLPDGVRVFAGLAQPGPHPVSENLEPEYVTVQGDTAWVTLQEANAVAVVDLAEATVVDVWSAGTVDHGVVPLDPSDRDGRVAPRTYPGLHGLRQPDGLASFVVDGETYLVTANEGDVREWGAYEESVRVGDLGADGLAPVCADSPLAALVGEAELGRLNVSVEEGLRAGTGDAEPCYEELFAFGGRSVTVFTADGDVVADSGPLLEDVTAAAAPGFAGSNHSESNLEGRSDDKGPEPEGVALGVVGDRTYAFVGLERVGGVAVLDLTDPASASFTTYLNNRDFAVSAEDALEGAADPAATLASAGDLGPEGVAFVAGADSPTGAPLLVVGNEVSGTTTLHALVAPLSDVGDAHPFRADVRWLQARGLASGYADGTFGADRPVSRQAMAAFLFRYADPTFEPPTTASFPDVPVGHPFFAAVEWMVAADLAEGYGDGTFGATRPVSRQAAAAFLHRLAGAPGTTAPTGAFPDVAAGHPFAGAVGWLTEAGVVDGYADGTFRPTAPVSRQAAAAFLHRLDRAAVVPDPV